ncbi:putative membrane protein YdgA-like protein (plasmid) [Legionella adelaidensis]|uniref:Putative membrane protein YdgA-like protein n=1 Tax=Legionella adelaidensis TaxID=45056 RepID=A0A0W0R5S8_9GAMM|nr:YdgA family protein [Legionella adelaidensis]KTC66452.1 putative membrane protein YdgA-like protein [Legionella adelaidensis]VEH86260.1 putative membrane protein YdgA-like protein [Legionella adelaidensis]
MKRILGLVVIIAALVLVSYYGMGLMTERTIKKDLQLINQSQGVHAELIEYKRGWFTSHAKFNWTLHIPERVVKNEDDQTTTTLPAQDYKLYMPLKVYHGPIIFADKAVHFGLGYGFTRLNLPQEYVQRFRETFTADSTIPQLDISVLVNYINKSRLRIKLPKFTLIAKEEGSRFEWLGMKNDVTISSDLSSIEGDFAIKGIQFSKDKIKGIVGKITSEYDLSMSPEGLYVGDASLSFPSFLMKEGDKKLLEMNDYDIETNSDIDDGLLNAYFKMSLDRIITSDKTYGPGILKIALKNLDAKVLAYINDQANKMQQGSEEQRQQAMMVLLPEIPKLLNKGARLEVSEAKFTMPEGTVEGNLWIQLPKGEFGNPFQLIQKVEGEGKVQMPMVVLKQVMLTSEKQQLSQPSLQQAMIDQLQKNQASGEQANNKEENTPNQNPADTNVNTDNTATQSSGSPQPQMTPAEIEQKAQVQSDQKIAALVENGLLMVSGENYVMQFKLANGQLSVNGRPFNPATMHF